MKGACIEIRLPDKASLGPGPAPAKKIVERLPVNLPVAVNQVLFLLTQPANIT
jgi:hypothetical protein